MTTLADLIDSVVNGAGYRSPVANAIANQRPDLPAVKQFERERERALAMSGPQGNAQDQMSGAYAPQPVPTLDNGRYFGADAVAMTGLPQLRSGVQHAANSYALRNDPQASADEAGAALPDIALGGLGVLGMLGGSGESLSGPRAAPQMPMQQLNFGRLWESEGAPIVPHDLAFDGARGSYPEGALNNDLDRWVMGGIRSRASELPTLIERQRGFMPGHDMESLIRMANHTRPGEFANILGTDLGEFGVGGKLEGTPLLGTPDIAADPLANTARPGFTRLPELPQRMANRADARWPMFGTLPPEPVTPLPVNPTRELGRAADGSVLPVRPAQPFRQSFVGGSGDLRDAAGLGGNDGSHALDPGAMTALRRELREHDFPVPADTASLPAVDIPLGDLRPGRIGTADAADARQYAAMGSEAPPILVRRQGAGWHIIDGNRRAAAARIKGAPTVRALDATDLFRAQSVHNVGSDGATSLNSTTPAFVPLGIGLLGASQTRRSNDNRNTKAPRGAFFHGRSH